MPGEHVTPYLAGHGDRAARRGPVFALHANPIVPADRPAAGLSWVRGRGCTHCSLTGYTGRVAVGELWTPGDEDAMLINMRAPFDQIRRSAARTTLPMAADVMDRLVRRETTVEEIVRTLPYTSLRQLREPQP